MYNDKNIAIKKKAAIISMVIGIGMFVAKIGAYFITGSAAIFSDAAESVVHVLATSMALYSILLSAKPPDESHPYGHGKVEYFSAGIEGLLIVLAALFIIYEAVYDLVTGVELQQLGTGVIIISAAGLINLFLGLYLLRTGNKTNSLALVADGKHVLTDFYTSLGVIIGIILVILTGLKFLDPVFAIAVALNILYTGFKLVRSSVGGLMNEIDPTKLEELTNTISEIRKDTWIDIHELRFWESADKIFLDFHLIMPYYFNIRTTHAEEKRIAELINEKFPGVQIKIHLDYCTPELCKFCKYKECDVREEEFKNDVPWTTEKLIGKAVYKL